jgi:exonuclease VII small subunit
MRQLGDALQVDVLGAHPFESAGTRVEQAADRADTAADKLDEAASEARSGAASLSSVAGHLDDAATSLAQIRSELEAIQNGSLRWLRFALIALGIWLFVPAAVALWLGVRLWRGSAAG